MRYVVTVNPPDDHPGFVRVFGPFRHKSEAESFCDAVREAVGDIPKHISDEVTGYAYVQELEPARRRAAKLWATKGAVATQEP